MRRLAALMVLLVAGSAHADEDGADPGLSKKAQLLADKQARPAVHRQVAPRLNAPPTVPISLRNTKTNEVLPIDPARPPPGASLDRFLRCHFTNQAAAMDPRLLAVIVNAAHRFKSDLVEIVSGFRAPKYNLMLRKKGHEVARDSQHPRGQAVDFRLPGLPTRQLLAFVKSLHLGGVGFYPHSAFVHTDVGRVRFWRGN